MLVANYDPKLPLSNLTITAQELNLAASAVVTSVRDIWGHAPVLPVSGAFSYSLGARSSAFRVVNVKNTATAQDRGRNDAWDGESSLRSTMYPSSLAETKYRSRDALHLI